MKNLKTKKQKKKTTNILNNKKTMCKKKLVNVFVYLNFFFKQPSYKILKICGGTRPTSPFLTGNSGKFKKTTVTKKTHILFLFV